MNDFAMLEEIIGEMDYNTMAMLRTESPNTFVFVITKIFNFLAYLAKIPIKDEDGDDVEMNLYSEALNTLNEKNVGPDG